MKLSELEQQAIAPLLQKINQPKKRKISQARWNLFASARNHLLQAESEGFLEASELLGRLEAIMESYEIECCQPGKYQYANCNCPSCVDRDRYENVKHEIKNEIVTL